MSAVPKLRFPEFDGNWIEMEMQELASISRGKFSARPRNDPSYYGGNIPFVQTGDVARSSGLLTKFTQTLNEKGLKVSKIFPENTIIITIAANIGDVAISTFPVAFPDSLVGINAKKENSTNFLFSQLSRKKSELLSYATQNAQANINLEVLKPLVISIPSLPEQQKIASFLSSVDKKVDLLRQKKDALELYKKGLMQKIFSQEIRFKQDDGSDFPDWEDVALGDVFTERSERGHGDKQLLGVTLSKGVVRASEIEKIDRSSSDLSNYKYVKVGDIAYNSMRMWQGASGASNYNGIVSPAYTVISPLGGNETKFWGYLFKYPEMIKVFERHSQGLTSDTWNLKFKALSTIKVLRPSGKEQKKISSYFTSIDAKMERLSSQIEQMETFKKGLLQQMFV